MSGIAGYINNTEKASSALLDSMSESIRYTESDRIDNWNDDFVAISRVHHGVINPEPQPIFNEDESLFILMDGEVFDYKEQKSKLIHNGHEFKFKNNDAEYCLHLYEEMGKDSFKEPNGSFCIAIYDLATHELLLINDRFSSRPIFYYLTDKGMLLFSTQLSSIIQSPEVPRKLNMKAIIEFFTFQRVLGIETFYKDIDILPPATFLHYRDSKISFSHYWEMKYKEEKHPEKYYVDKLAKAIKKSVRRRTQGNYRFGLLLSGGLDSRTVLAASDKKMVCFTVGDFKNREVGIAKKIAETKDYKHIFLERSSDHYANLVDKAVEIGDGMYSFVHAHNIGFFDQIRKECDVLLHGNPPELFFRGTSLPRGRELKIFGKRITVPILCRLSDDTLEGTVIKKMKYGVYQKNPKQLFIKSYSSVFDEVLANSIRSILTEASKKVTNVYDKFLWFDIYYTSRYPSFLFETSIRGFMDERTVLLFDNNLLDLHLKMPFKIRSDSRVWKKALAKLDPKIAAIPDANTGHPIFTPDILEWGLTLARSVISMIKKYLVKSQYLSRSIYTQGSWPNYAELIRYNEKLKKNIEDTINDPESLDPSIFNISKTKEIFKKHLDGKSDYSPFLFLLLTFGRWHKKYGPHTTVMKVSYEN